MSSRELEAKKIFEIMQKEYERLSKMNQEEIVEKFKDVYTNLVLSQANVFIATLLSFTPMKITPPHETFTAATTDDGYVYINPVFWQAIFKYFNENQKEEYASPVQQLTALVMHEQLHQLEFHIPVLKEFSEYCEQRGISRQQAQKIANVIADYIINNDIKKHMCEEKVTHFDIIGVLEDSVLEDNLKMFGVTQQGVNRLMNYLKQTSQNEWTLEESLQTIRDEINAIPIQKFNFLFSSGPARETENQKGSNGKNENKTEGQKITAENPSSRTDKNPNQGNEKQDWNVIVTNDKLTEEELKKILGSASEVNEGFMDKETKKEGYDGIQKKIQEVLERLEEEYSEYRDAGYVPAGLKRKIQEIRNAKMKDIWKDVIKSSLETYLNQIQSTYERPNRRQIEGIPYVKFQNKGKAWVLLDTSGSMSDDEISTVTVVARTLLNKGYKVYVQPWDAEAYESIELKKDSDIKTALKSVEGGGGTLITPALEKVRKEVKQGDVVTIISDCGIADSKDEVEKLLKDIYKKTHNKIVVLDVTSKNDAAFGLSGPYVKTFKRSTAFTRIK